MSSSLQNSLNLEGVEQQPLREYTEKAYLDYSMYVILDRALPQIGDGLKAGPKAHCLRHERAGLVGRFKAEKIRAHGR